MAPFFIRSICIIDFSTHGIYSYSTVVSILSGETMNSGLSIRDIQPSSIAEEIELMPGDTLVAINGNPINDVIDYEFYIGDSPLVLEILRCSGEQWEIEVERYEGETLGLVFDPPEPERCNNNCVFCFVHQLPRGLRSSLYVKDEDYRLSFLYGTYITLTNLSAGDFQRIKELKLSPLYISVHATDPAIRGHLLGRANLPPIRDLLNQLIDAGITLHTQVVLCPGINDEQILEQTVSDLAELYPHVASVAVIPVGLTRHRKCLPQLQPVTAEYAAQFVHRWSYEAERLADSLGEPFLFLADEFFIRGDVPFPLLSAYGELPQLENGVGMIPLFLAEADDVIFSSEQLPPVTITAITGISAYPYLSSYLARLAQVTGAVIELIAIPNNLFGPSITVAGLVTGRDIITLIKNRHLGSGLFIPDVMLTDGKPLFIDGVTLEDLSSALECEVIVVPATPHGMYERLKWYAERST